MPLWEIIKFIGLCISGLVLLGFAVWLISLSKWAIISLVAITVVLYIWNKIAELKTPSTPQYILKSTPERQKKTIRIVTSPQKRGAYYPNVHFNLPDSIQMQKEQRDEDLLIMAATVQNSVDVTEVAPGHYAVRRKHILSPEELKLMGKTRVFWRRPTPKFDVSAIKTIRY